jgi:hypothetical protein
MMLPPSPPAKCLFQDAILTCGRKGAKERERGADWFNICIAVKMDASTCRSARNHGAVICIVQFCRSVIKFLHSFLDYSPFSVPITRVIILPRLFKSYTVAVHKRRYVPQHDILLRIFDKYIVMGIGLG